MTEKSQLTGVISAPEPFVYWGRRAHSYSWAGFQLQKHLLKEGL